MSLQKCIFGVKINMIDRPCVNSVDLDQIIIGSTEMYFWSEINMIDRPCVNSVDLDQTIIGSTEMYFWSEN